MKINFQQQTGELLIGLKINANSQSGSAEIKFGSDQLNKKAFSFFLENGKFIDNDGIFFGSYENNKTYNIDTYIKDDYYSYYYNGIPIRTNCKYINQDFNHLELLKSGANNDNYFLNISVSGKEISINNNILYITNNYNLESGIINLISGSKIFQGNIKFNITHDDYTGILNTNKKNEINSYNLIVFGQSLNTKNFNDISGWSNCSTPIIFLNSLVASQSGIGIISGNLYKSIDYEKIWGKSGENLNLKYNFSNSILRRNIIDYSGIGYNLYNLQSGKFLVYDKIYDQESILINNSGNNLIQLDEITSIITKNECDPSSSSSNNSESSVTNSLIMLDIIKTGEKTWENGLAQSEKRLIFNNPIIETGLFDITTDEWKKILLSSIYELTQINTQISYSSTSSSSSSSSSSLFWKEKLNDSSRNWYATAISENGQYQSAVILGSNGNIWVSSDYGNNWSQKSSFINGFIHIAMSYDGQYQTALGFNGRIWRSYDYGTSFSEITSMSTKGWRSVSISGDGKYQTAVVYSGKIWRSDDYGVTWSEVLSSNSTGWVSVAVSKYGNIQSAVTSSIYGKIYRSLDFGQTWEDITQNQMNHAWIAISSSGMYQTIGITSGYIYRSSDFGKTWTQSSSSGARNWRYISMEASGRTQIAVAALTNIYISYDYGQNWQAIDGVKNWRSISISNDALYIIAAAYGNYLYLNGLVNSSSSSRSSSSSSISSLSSSLSSQSSSSAGPIDCINFNGTGINYSGNYEYTGGLLNNKPYWTKTGETNSYIYWASGMIIGDIGWGVDNTLGNETSKYGERWATHPSEPINIEWYDGISEYPITTGCII